MSARRQIRLRKEFIHKKQIDLQQSARDDKKRKLIEAIDEGKSIPTEIVSEARVLQHEIELDVQNVGEGQQAIDDEYSNIGLRDPKVCVTTSRDPSSRLKQFSKEIKLCIPNAQAINRGSYRTDELVDACRKADFTDMVFLNETRGNPDALIITHLPYGPTASFTLSSCVLRHDIPECGHASEAYPHLIIDGFETKIGKRFARILQAIFPIPKPDSHRVLTYANRNDFISFRHHVYTKTSQQGKSSVVLKEVGPRFEMQPYELRLGTIDNDEAEKEWVLRPYMNTSRKHQSL